MKFNSIWRYRHSIFTHRFAKALLRSRQNIISDHIGRPPIFGPFMAELDVTYRCNCKCRMCQRWQHSHSGELTLPEYRRLAEVFQRMGVQLVSIAGGEPLLRKDICSIVKTFADCGMYVNLCTNGILLDTFEEALGTCGASFITVSLDGATARRHDEIRGTPGSFVRIRNNLLSFAASDKKKRPLVRIRMTFSNANMHEVKPFYLQWQNTVDDVLLQPVHHSCNSYYTGLQANELRLNPRWLEKNLKGTSLEKDGYMGGLVESLRHTGTYPKRRCYAGVLMVRVDPWGRVFPCLEQHTCVGSLREEDFSDVWRSRSFNLERERIREDGNCRCWYNNTAMISYYGGRLNLTTAKGLMAARQGRFGNDHRMPNPQHRLPAKDLKSST